MSYSHYQDVPRCTSILQDATHMMEYRLQTTPTTAMYRYEARRLRLPILYDLDDPLFSVSAYATYENMKALHPSYKRHFLAEAPKYLEMMNGADILTVSTPGMVEHTRFYSPRPVYMRRNFADIATLEDGTLAMTAANGSAPQDDLFRVAFASGSQGHEADFAILESEMIAFLDADPSHRLMILGHFNIDLLPEALQTQVETHPFSTYETYLKTLASADCAVMPLVDDAFNRCKSAVRVIDAASVGVPSIVNKVSDMANMVLHEKTGLIAHTSAGWGEALATLAADRNSTRAMGQAARHDLETRWAGLAEDHIIAPEVMEWVKG
ncbi:MAG: glycosyltransferase [Sulfitobacter sp.]